MISAMPRNTRREAVLKTTRSAAIKRRRDEALAKSRIVLKELRAAKR